MKGFKAILLGLFVLLSISSPSFSQHSERILKFIESADKSMTQSYWGINLFSSPYDGAMVSKPRYGGYYEMGFVVDPNWNRIVYGDEGKGLSSWVKAYGSWGSGNGQFKNPHGIAADKWGNVYVADTGNNRIVKLQCNFDTGSMTFVKNIYGNLNEPYDVAISWGGTPDDPSDDRIWVVDRGNHRLVEFSKEGTFLSAIGTQGSGEWQFNSPTAVTVLGHGMYSGSVFLVVADTGNHRSVSLARDGDPLQWFKWDVYQFPSVSYLIGTAGGYYSEYYVVDHFEHVIHKLKEPAIYLANFGGLGYGNNKFLYPTSIISAYLSPENIGVCEAWTENSGLKRYIEGVDVLNLTATPLADGSGVLFSYILPSAGFVTERVRNQSGQVIKTLRSNVFTSSSPKVSHTWYGDNDSGNKVPFGHYTIEVYVQSPLTWENGQPVDEFTNSIDVEFYPVESIWVDDSNNSGIEDGSYAYPYNTISEALDAATSGKTVYVMPGTYSEVVHMKSGVDLVGWWWGSEGDVRPTIQVSGYYPAVTFENVTNAILKGFKLKGYAAVKCYNSESIIIEGNKMYDSEHGIYCYESSPVIKNNTIVGNDYGIYASSHSDPEIYNGYNDIQGNSYGVRCSYYSEPYLGYDDFNMMGNNNINNSTWDVYAYSNCGTIYAVLNYWQNGGDPKLYHANPDYDIIYLPMRASNPLSKQMIAQRSSGEDAREHLRRGMRFLFRGKYQDALGEFQYIIDNYPDTQEARFALDKIVETYKKWSNQTEAFSFLERLAQAHATSLLGGIALEFVSDFDLKNGNVERAIARLINLRNRFSDTEMSKHLLFKLGMIYKYDLQDRKRAEQAFRSFINQYPRDEMVGLAEMELNTMDLPNSEENAKEPFYLSQNYPNPFNPITEIRYRISESSFVTLKIYNILGQEVTTLVEGRKDAGFHTVLWDGRNTQGRIVASGIYFYVIRAGKFTAVKKMILFR